MTAQRFATVKARENEPHMCRHLLVRTETDAAVALTFQTRRGQWLERLAPCGFLAFLLVHDHADLMQLRFSMVSDMHSRTRS